MRMRRFIACTVFFVSVIMTAHGQPNPEREGLRGVAGIRVIVEPLRSTVEGTGLNREQLQADVELRFRKAGVRVLDDDSNSKLSPYIYVNANVLRIERSSNFVSNVRVELNRLGLFSQGPNKEAQQLFGAMWGREIVSIIPQTQFASSIREDVGNLVDMFLNDYLAANPKP